MTHEEKGNLYGLIKRKNIELLLKNQLIAMKSPGPDGFTSEFYKIL